MAQQEKKSACNAGDAGLILELGISPGGGNGNPLQYFHLKNPWTVEPGGLQSKGSKSQTRLGTHTPIHYNTEKVHSLIFCSLPLFVH